MKIISYLFICLSSGICCAQKYGIKGGINLSKEHFSESGINVETDSYQNYHLGVFSEFPILDEIYINGELFYSVEGGEI